MIACDMVRQSEDSRDASYVKVSLYFLKIMV